MSEEKITLDSSTFKALASDTRVKILKLLALRPFTQTELADGLGIKVPSLKEHLGALEHGGLVKKHDEGRKWKYYQLTEKGKCVLNPERKKLWIALGLFTLSAIGMITRLAQHTLPIFGARSQELAFAPMTQPVIAPVQEAAQQAAMDATAQEAVRSVMKNALMNTTRINTTTDTLTQANTTAIPSPSPDVLLVIFALSTIILALITLYYFSKVRNKKYNSRHKF